MKLVTTSQTFSLIRLGTNFAYDFFQKQSPDVFYKKTVLKKFHNVQRLTPALESIFNELERFARCSLLVSFCSWLVTFSLLLVSFCSWLVSFCSLLVTFYSLLEENFERFF